ncbi:MAG: class 1 fructose-bisphosphatase [Candidatus Bathyarchaeia archaeon]|jgi:fructose-1,6-bisphosphatase I
MQKTSLIEVLKKEDPSLGKLVTLLADLSLLIGAEIPKTLGSTTRFNVYGENQQEIDVWTNDLVTKKLAKSRLVREIASEEIEKPLTLKQGEFSITLDPLDGSSNIKSNNLIGTIVGIYRETSLPAKGRKQIAAMYFLYGPYTQLVLALDDGVFIFVAARKTSASSCYLSSGNLHKLPERGIVYGFGGQKKKWTPKVQAYVQSLETRGLKLRYGGSFVGDFNQVLYYGGVFAYPELVDAPTGKLRLQFESNPIAFITEKVGGKGSTGTASILDVEPTSIDQRVPTYMGNVDLINELEQSMKS